MSLECMPSFLSLRDTVKPGQVLVDEEQRDPVGAAPPGVPVRATSRMKSQRTPLVMYSLLPLIRQWPSTRSARVRMLATSLPASGSVMPSAAIFSPRIAGTR